MVGTNASAAPRDCRRRCSSRDDVNTTELRRGKLARARTLNRSAWRSLVARRFPLAMDTPNRPRGGALRRLENKIAAHCIYEHEDEETREVFK